MFNLYIWSLLSPFDMILIIRSSQLYFITFRVHHWNLKKPNLSCVIVRDSTQIQTPFFLSRRHGLVWQR